MSEFGTGIKLDADFDVSVPNGTLQTIDDRAVIERDIAFTLVRETTPERGQVPDAGFRAEIELVIRRVLNRDPRIDSIQALSIDLDVDSNATQAEIALTVDTVEGATDALLITI
jgi:hypothetical protein